MDDYLKSEKIEGIHPVKKYTVGHKNGTRKHLGQLKLAISLTQFLNYCILHNKGMNNETKIYLIYIGAAHGMYMGQILDMFPGLTIEAWDPVKMKTVFVNGKDRKRMIVHQTLFLDDDVTDAQKRIEKKRDNGYLTLFVSDIRRDVHGETSKDRAETELIIEEDMKMQQEWAKGVSADYSQLKFHLPYSYIEGYPDYSKENMVYFGGRGTNIFKQVFPPLLSTESRIIVPRSNLDTEVTYDTQKFEDQMFYHNAVIREHQYSASKFLTLRSTMRFDSFTAENRRSYDAYWTMRTLADYTRRVCGMAWNSASTIELEKLLLDRFLSVCMNRYAFRQLAPVNVPLGT